MGEISLHILSCNVQFSDAVKNILHAENKILLSGYSSGFENIDLTSAKSFRKRYRGILLINDINLEKTKLLNFLNDIDTGFFSSSKRIIYTDTTDALYLRNLFIKDIRGILHKDETTPSKNPQKFIETIQFVHNGCNCYDNIITSLVRPVWARGNGNIISEPEKKFYKTQIDLISALSKREKEVLILIGEGKKNNEIAEILCISPHTVEAHKNHLIIKLALKNSAELTVFASIYKVIIKL